MRADYDSEANAISITLVQGVHAQRAVGERYGLDPEALIAAANAAIAVPDRAVTLEVAVRSTA
jgi:hypothetical protein